jgi:hypothetical protein
MRANGFSLLRSISKLSARTDSERILAVREIENAIVLLKRSTQKATEFVCPQLRSKIEFALLFNLGAASREAEKMTFLISIPGTTGYIRGRLKRK